MSERPISEDFNAKNKRAQTDKNVQLIKINNNNNNINLQYNRNIPNINNNQQNIKNNNNPIKSFTF